MSDYRTPGAAEAYDRYADMLFRTAFSLLLNKQDAEDAVSDVFAKFISKPPVFKNSDHEKAWFLKVTVNTCHDRQRRRAVRRYTPLDEIAEILAAQQKDTTVLDSDLAIDEKYRICILLHYFEDFSIEQTAKILKITQSAVKMRLSRAREMLKSALS